MNKLKLKALNGKTLIINKTCSCGVAWASADRKQYETNEMGNWFTCLFCDSTMLIPLTKEQKEEICYFHSLK